MWMYAYAHPSNFLFAYKLLIGKMNHFLTICSSQDVEWRSMGFSPQIPKAFFFKLEV